MTTKNQKKSFRSYTDINNYNKFLLHLDNQQRSESIDQIEQIESIKSIDQMSKKNVLDKKKVIDKKKVNIQFDINNICDLLKIIDQYPDDKDVEYNIDIHLLHKIKEPLTNLNNMIGMKTLKENIMDQLLYYSLVIIYIIIIYKRYISKTI